MRLTAVLLLVLCTSASHALTAEPPSPSPSPTPEQQSATVPGGEHNAGPVSPATTPAEPAATPNAGKPKLTREDQELTSLGYKVEMRRGQKWFCRRETQLGSHFELKNCNTAESIQAHRDTSMEEVRKIQASGKPHDFTGTGK